MGWNDHNSYESHESFRGGHSVGIETWTNERQHAAESIAGRIMWSSAKTGMTACPLGHTCVVHIDDNPVPVFKCLHERCQEELRAWTLELQRQCELVGGPRKETPEEKKARLLRQNQDKVMRRAESLFRRYELPAILKTPEVTVAQWKEQSPHPLPQDRSAEWRLLVSGLYLRHDTLWMGDLHQTGSEFFTVSFKHVAEWLKKPYHPGAQICPGIFFPWNTNGERIYERSKNLVRLRPYLVAESDTLRVGQFGSVVQHLRRKGMTLRALVSTGGKSVHAWFDNPFAHERHLKLSPTHELAERKLHATLRGLGCDPHMFNPNSTTRLPGCDRYHDETGQIVGEQRLLYFNPKHEPYYEEHP